MNIAEERVKIAQKLGRSPESIQNEENRARKEAAQGVVLRHNQRMKIRKASGLSTAVQEIPCP